MKGRRSELERIRDMRQAIAAIWRYRDAVREMPVPPPEGMLEQAVMNNLTIIGEAANRISPETRNLAPEVPWRDMIAFRNRLVQMYHDCSLEIVEDTVHNDLPVLDAALARIEAQLTADEQAPGGQAVGDQAARQPATRSPRGPDPT